MKEGTTQPSGVLRTVFCQMRLNRDLRDNVDIEVESLINVNGVDKGNRTSLGDCYMIVKVKMVEKICGGYLIN